MFSASIALRQTGEPSPLESESFSADVCLVCSPKHGKSTLDGCLRGSPANIHVASMQADAINRAVHAVRESTEN